MTAVVAQRLTARDGFILAADLFAPQRPRGVVQINSAIGVPRGFYAPFATWLAEQGLAVVTYDYRGVGDSQPAFDVEGFEPHIREWGELDAASVTDWCGAVYPALPLTLIGHSLGGQLAGLCDNNARYDRVIAVASQSGFWGHWPEAEHDLRHRLWEALRDGDIDCRTASLPELPASIARSWARWCLSPAYVVDDDGSPIRQFFSALTAPMTFFLVEGDPMAPRTAVEALMSLFDNAPKTLTTLRLQPGAGVGTAVHFAMFRPAARALWPELAAGAI